MSPGEQNRQSMDFDHPPPDPVVQCRHWLDEAHAYGLKDAGAVTLATADAQGRPSARTVLLKAFDERGAIFYTNRLSRKGRDLQANPRATLLFFWDKAARQLRIEGAVSKIPDAESDAYFSTRDRASQIGAWASRQSEPLGSRAELLAAVAKTAARFGLGAVPRPPHWGGYRVSLEQIEFWQGRSHRLHDRLVYTADGRGGWTVRRLFP